MPGIPLLHAYSSLFPIHAAKTEPAAQQPAKREHPAPPVVTRPNQQPFRVAHHPIPAGFVVVSRLEYTLLCMAAGAALALLLTSHRRKQE